MARSIADIQKAIIADVQAQPELAAMNSTSKRAIWRLWTFVVAIAISLLEQIQDVFTSSVEATVALAAPQTAQWIQAKVFEFQYDATTPQVLQLINLVPQYPVINTDLRIVTRCSVKKNLNNSVLIKVAKSAVPEALITAEINALQSYINILGVTGIRYQVTSANSDKLYVEADIYYAGEYASVIQATVIAAIEAYLAALPFDGAMVLSNLETYIKAVTGVNDIVFKIVRARKDSDSLSVATYLVQNSQLLSRLWATQSGYIVGETTSGSTLNDTLNFIAE